MPRPRNTAWVKLAERFPRTTICAGQRWQKTRVQVNGERRRSGRNTVGADDAGLFLGRSLLWGLFVSPPIQIPWAAMRLVMTDRHGEIWIGDEVPPNIVILDRLVAQSISISNWYSDTSEPQA